MSVKLKMMLTRRLHSSKNMRQQSPRGSRRLRRRASYAKETRVQEQCLKAAQREEAKIAQQVNQQLHNDVKLAPRGKQKIIEPQLSTAEDEDVDLSSIVDVVPTPARSRRSRQINLPM